MNRSLTLIIIFAVVLSGFFTLLVLRNCFARSIVVPDDYGSINAAIEEAREGDVIYVKPGVYKENIRLNKAIRLIGEAVESTIIDGECCSNVLDIYNIDGYVEVQGFTIRNASGYINQLGLSGISIFRSKNVKIFNNIIENCTKGLEVRNSTNVEIGYNIIKNCTYGIYSSTVDKLSAYANTIANNRVGVVIASSITQNVFYRNNFVNNEKNVDVKGSSRWDNGAEGNFWSDYTGEDLNGDGIGDTNLPHFGLDYKPLVEPWSLYRYFKVQEYTVEVVSNTTIASFFFNQTSGKLSFNSTGPSSEHGFCNVTIPKNLMNGNFTVFVNKKPLEFIITGNVTHNFLHFVYTFSSTENIVIAVTEEYSPPIPPTTPTSFPPLEIQILLGAAIILVLIHLIKKLRQRSPICSLP